MAPRTQPPSHILIVGSGVFGLGALSAFLERPLYKNTRFTVVAPSSQHKHTASWDSTRIVRSDYSDPAYSALGAAAQERWRQDPWKQDYFESGLLLSEVLERDTAGAANGYAEKALATTSKTVPPGAIEVFKSREALSKAMRVNGDVKSAGTVGYINHLSGWADAGGALDRLHDRLAKDARVTFVDGQVEYLLTAAATATSAKPRVAGAHVSGHVGSILADLTILATGAWTPALIDMRGIASCTAQCMLYISLTEQEASTLSGLPVCIDFNEGRFFFPPTSRTNEQGAKTYQIKAAKHAYGYTNATLLKKDRVLGPLLAKEPSHKPYAPSLPCAPGRPIPDTDAQGLLHFLAKSLPLLKLNTSLASRSVNTRICHYLDTKTGDFIVSGHPEFDERSLFVMTGGSGHAFKFLPKIGDVSVDVFERSTGLVDHGARTLDIDVWRSKWAWPQRERDDVVWCEDGSRGGYKNVSLASERPAQVHRPSKL